MRGARVGVSARSVSARHMSYMGARRVGVSARSVSVRSVIARSISASVMGVCVSVTNASARREGDAH